ncbi:uracil-DNA glycosylase [Aquabacterium sp. A08]|uniref:uracil-DNA glycosylase n=1 Tax=Aquabacterium sp. A08 TaxID=2718532 RepID=UPI00142260BD|nr:uracil-DNA glycosylase [Aquabacterium sp. A08]NIC41568.1 uracil-DNA glycosylase [Aquabacterium sp. A08]
MTPDDTPHAPGEPAADAGAPATHSPLPRLDARQCAMLEAMGVPVWWQRPAPAAAPARGPRPAGGLVHSSAPPERPRPAPTTAVAGHASPAEPVLAPPQAATGEPAHAVRAVAPRPTHRTVPLAVDGAPNPWAGLDTAGLDAAIRGCTRCDLAPRRQHAVPGMGDPAPDWLIVGEAPGEEEDRQGLPFVGRAGQLLDRMLAAMGLERAQRVYIANVIKCRPPQNRNPSPEEIGQCTPYLLRQVELLRPRIVLAMGRFAAQTVLGQGGALDPAALQTLPLGKLRGQVHRVTLGGQTLPVVVTYHPAYLLRSPGEKAKAWADLCLALDTLATLPPRA